MRGELCDGCPPSWRITSVQSLATRVTSGGTPSRSRPEYFQGGSWPWVKTQELHDTWLDETEEHITEEAVQASAAKVLPASTVLVALYGATIAQLGILRRPMTCNQACCAVIVDPAQADFRFVFYQLLAHRSQLRSLGVGAAQQNISGALIKQFLIPVPPLSEQQAIVRVLSALDDKIEANRGLNETLEATCQALFRSWFVDFDPVVAKSEGRKPAHLSSEVAALFPARLQDTENGPIPEGWRFSAIAQIASLSRESINPLDHPTTEFTLYSIPSYDTGAGPEGQLGDAIKSNKYVLRGPCVLVSKLNPRIPRVWFPDLIPTKPSIASTEFLVTSPKGKTPLGYLYQLFRSDAFLDEFATLVTGTSGSHQRVKPNDFLCMRTVGPPLALQQVAGDLFSTSLERVLANVRESRTLATLRDALLPRLLSGELRVRQAEELVEEVV